MQISYGLTTVVCVFNKELGFLDAGKMCNGRYILIYFFSKFSQCHCLVENCIQNFNFKQ